MDHLDNPIGTIVGHIVPGSLFLLWGLWWLRPAARERGPFASSWEPFVALPAILGGALLELWWGGWRMTDRSVMNVQHATMYVAFAIPAASAILARRGVVSSAVPLLALGGSFGAAGLLFVAHGSPTPVSDAIHVLLAFLFLAAAVISVSEGVMPSRALAVTRAWLTLAIGGWFCVAGWLLGASGYDMHAPMVILRVRMFLIWDVMAAAFVLAGWQLMLAPTAAPAPPPIDAHSRETHVPAWPQPSPGNAPSAP